MYRMLCLALFVAASLPLPGVAQTEQKQADQKSDLSAKIAELAGAYVEWGAQSSTSGAQLTLKEVSHSGTRLEYHLVVSGLPHDGTYAVVTWPVTESAPAAVINPAFIAPSGIVLCKKNGDVTSSGDTVNLTLDTVRGEPARIGLVNLQDKTQRALARITPRPIEVTDGKCRLSATYLTPRGEVVFAEADGLHPGDKITVALHSGSKEVKLNAVASPAGSYRASFLPFDPKNEAHKGHAELRLTAPGCSPSLEFPWGNLLNP